MNTTHIHHIRHVGQLHVHFPSAAALESLDLGPLIPSDPFPPQPGAAPAAASALTPPAPGEAWPGQGGIYLATLPAQFGLPARHLIAATDEHTGLAWGGYDHDTTGAASQTDGSANTVDLLTDSKDHPAAQWAAQYTEDGHKDYFLPSRFDLFMAWLSAPQVFSKSDWYWSSSQSSRHSAFIQDFEYGGSTSSGKGTEYRVRPVRTIPLL